MKRKLAAIFDFDDTLLSTFESRSPCLIETAANFGYRIEVNDIRLVWGMPFEQMILAMLPGINYRDFYQNYQAEMLRFPPILKPGALELLNKIKSTGSLVLIFSSSSHSLVEQDLNVTGLLHLVDKIWGQEDMCFKKSNPRSFEPVLAHLKAKGFPLDSCFYIGDSVIDFLVAKNNKITFFAVISGSDNAKTFMESGLPPEKIFSTLKEFIFPPS